MQTRPAFQYIHMGVVHWFLQHVQPGFLVHSAPGAPGVLELVEGYLKDLATFDLAVTTGVGWELNGIREELRALPEGSALSTEVAARIRQVLQAMEGTLNAESGAKTVFVVTEKRFDVNNLLYNVGKLLRPGAYMKLPALAAGDLREAGICIAFDRPTAAAFHLLRGTEGALRHYYSCVVKRNRLAQPWLWKAMTDHMAAKRKPPPKTLLDNLDALRENFRNPTSHPEKTYDIDEAQDLLAACVDVVNRMTHSAEWSDPADSFGVRIAELAAQLERTPQTSAE